MRDPRDAAHRARHDGHGVPAGAAAGEGGLVIAHPPDRTPYGFAQVAPALESPYFRRGARDADADLDIGSLTEHREQTLRVGRSTRARDADDDLALHGITCARTIDATPSVRSNPTTPAKPAPATMCSYSCRVRKPAMLRER